MIDQDFPFEHFTGPSASAASATNPLSSSVPFDEINKKIMSHLKSSLEEEVYYSCFFNTLLLTSLDEHIASFTASSDPVKIIIEDHHLEKLKNATQLVLGKEYKIHILSPLPSSDHEFPKTSRKKKLSAKNVSFSLNLSSEKTPLPKHEPLPPRHEYRNLFIDPKKTFENFIVGSSNKMAHASTLAISQKPGRLYPSLFLYSAPGFGKTHLLHALANAIRKNHAALTVYMTTARNFMREMMKSIGEKNSTAFRTKYMEEIDVLMIDDIHELKRSQQATQNELLYIFNEFQNNKKQLVFTSHSPPKDLLEIQETLKNRLGGGLILDIQPPEMETRISILKKKAVEQDIFLTPETIAFIASHTQRNIRDLESSLIRLVAYSSIFNIDIDIEIAKEQLNFSRQKEQKTLSVEMIATLTAQHFNFSLSELKSKSRFKAVSGARHLAMFLCYTRGTPKPTYAEIGLFFGGRDHSTVLYAIEKIQNLCNNSSQKIIQAIAEIENLFYAD